MNDNYHLLGKGVYSIQDAMAFSGLSFARVRHWIRGDKRSGKFGRKENSPIICLQHGIINGVYTLGFLDLVELLMISKINEEGISVRAIRSMHDNAQNWLEKSHPFAYYKIYTAGIDLIIKLSDDS
ncbi:MAG TPA: hypothetical protein ENH10_02105, partial [Bacteroidetes bacterium]|nr:hypothetical protein [Bacteroidota bacterium]HEX03934.1 hypothetical protein [Bacteroidota bacterium]